jgi:glycosyltransferase involved in cell wall biosynthesis
MDKNSKMSVFIIHPRLMDYRLPLFINVDNEFNAVFFFRQSSLLDKKLKQTCVSKKNRIKISLKQLIPLDDLFFLIKEIKNSNVVISSFMLDIYSVVSLFLCLFFKKKFILWEEISIGTLKRISLLKLIIFKILIKKVNAFFVLGNIQKDALKYLGVKLEKILIANEYPGFDYGKIVTKSFLLPFSNDKKILLYFGRLEEVKGVHYLIKAFDIVNKHTQEFVLLIVGNGSFENKLKKYVKEHNVKNIYFIDSIYNINEKAYIFKKAYMGIVPSILLEDGTTEGGPLIVLEYLSAGLPIVGTDKLGSSNEFICSSVNGIIINDRDSDGLSSAILHLHFMISKKKISSSKIMEEFKKIPNHNYQFKKLKEAIMYEE